MFVSYADWDRLTETTLPLALTWLPAPALAVTFICLRGQAIMVLREWSLCPFRCQSCRLGLLLLLILMVWLSSRGFCGCRYLGDRINLLLHLTMMVLLARKSLRIRDDMGQRSDVWLDILETRPCTISEYVTVYILLSGAIGPKTTDIDSTVARVEFLKTVIQSIERWRIQ